MLDVETWRLGQLQLGRKGSTINRAWERMRAVLGKAVEWKIIPGPALQVKKLKLDARGRVRFLSPEEQARLFKALEEREQERREKRTRLNLWRQARHRPPLPTLGCFTDYLQPLVRVWLGTGLRRSEALQLVWGDVNFAWSFLNVRGEITKTGQSRAIPMTADVRRALLVWRELQAENSPSTLVFSRGGKRIRRVNTAWKNLMWRAEITNFRVHDTRHDFASRLAMADVALLTIAKLLGHEDVKMVLRYAHLSSGHLREAVEKLDSAKTLGVSEAAVAIDTRAEVSASAQGAGHVAPVILFVRPNANSG